MSWIVWAGFVFLAFIGINEAFIVTITTIDAIREWRWKREKRSGS